MSWFDWLILIQPVCLVMGMDVRTMRYVRGVADFLSAGRLCGRYQEERADCYRAYVAATMYRRRYGQRQ